MAKKYSINWENEEPVSFEVDGVTYNSLDDVPSEKDRNKLAAMVDASAEDFFDDVKFDEKEFEELRKAAENPTMERWVLGGFTGIAVVMILVAANLIFYQYSKDQPKRKAPPGVWWMWSCAAN